MIVQLLGLKTAREKALLTGEELARAAKISATTYWTAEHGGNVSIKTARKIAKALKSEVTELQSLPVTDLVMRGEGR